MENAENILKRIIDKLVELAKNISIFLLNYLDKRNFTCRIKKHTQFHTIEPLFPFISYIVCLFSIALPWLRFWARMFGFCLSYFLLEFRHLTRIQVYRFKNILSETPQIDLHTIQDFR